MRERAELVAVFSVSKRIVHRATIDGRSANIENQQRLPITHAFEAGCRITFHSEFENSPKTLAIRGQVFRLIKRFGSYVLNQLIIAFPAPPVFRQLTVRVVTELCTIDRNLYDQAMHITIFSAITGFLGTRGSFMLDFVFVAMFAAILIMGWSIYEVKYRRRFALHRMIQITLGVVLLVAVIAFEVEMRLSGWTHRAEPSKFWVDGSWNDWIDYSLAIHLLFAIPTPFIWAYVIIQGVRKFPKPPAPNEYSRSHILSARFAAFEMFMTTVTGWAFYYLAFVA